jgi:hypothetical protein
VSTFDPDRTLRRIDTVVQGWESGPDAARWHPGLADPAPDIIGEMWLGPAGDDPGNPAGWRFLGYVAGEVRTE